MTFKINFNRAKISANLDEKSVKLQTKFTRSLLKFINSEIINIRYNLPKDTASFTKPVMKYPSPSIIDKIALWLLSYKK